MATHGTTEMTDTSAAKSLDVLLGEGEAALDKYDFHSLEELIVEAGKKVDDLSDRQSVPYARYCYLKGSLLLEKHQTTKAESLLSESLEIFENQLDDQYLGMVLNQMGQVEHRLGQYQMALKLYTDALTHSEAAGHKINMVKVHNNLGVTKRHLRNYENSIEDFKKALQLATENKYFDILGGIYSNLGAVYGMTGDIEQAIEHHEKSVKILKKNEGKYRIIQAMNNLGRTFLLNNQLDEAHRCYEEVRKYIDDSEEYLNNLLMLNINFGILYRKKNELDKALVYFEQALEISKLVGSLANEKSIYKNLSDILEEKGDYKQALDYMRKFFTIQNKIVEENTKDSINQVVAQFELQQQRRERETYRMLNRELERSNKDLESFAYVASHDLKEPLRMINTYMGLFEKRYGHLIDENGKEFIAYAQDGGKRMSVLLDDLLNYSRIATRGKDFEPTELQEVMDFVLSNLDLRIEELGAKVTYTKPLPTVNCDKSQFIQLLQNLLANSLKFHSKDVVPEIHIEVEDMDDFWRFSVADNGIGIEPKFHEKVFELLSRVHAKSEYEGSGIGLSIVRKIAQRHKGRTWLESEVGKGTTIYLEIPKAP